MGLFIPAWKSKNPEKARRAVERLTNQKKIGEAAKKARHEEIRKLAVNKLTDEIVLADVAKYTFTREINRGIYTVHQDTCFPALEKLTDRRLIFEVAKSAWNPKLGEAAMKKLTDENDIAELMMRGRSEWFGDAMKKIKNPALLEKIRKTNDNPLVRGMAKDRLIALGVTPYESVSYAKRMNDIAVFNYFSNWAKRLADYKGMKEYNEEIYDAVHTLIFAHTNIPYKGSENTVKQREAAKQLISLLSNDKFAAGLFWKDCAQKCGDKHSDHSDHVDWDWGVSHHEHSDSGICVSFPPYPFDE